MMIDGQSHSKHAVLLCSSLEPGRDGVGDHVRRIAGELVLRGHSVAAIALNDPYACERSVEQEDSLTLFRFPSSQGLKSNLSNALDVLQGSSEAVVFWHFVPWGYRKYGLATPELYKFSLALSHHEVVLMFHELWVWRTDPDWHKQDFKEMLLGLSQRLWIYAFIRAVRPRAVATSNRTYSRMLHKLGISSLIWPMFSNIPQPPGASLLIARPTGLRVALFGMPRRDLPIERVLNPLVTHVSGLATNVEVFCVGRIGQHSQQLIRGWKERMPSVIWHELGMQSDEAITRLFASCHFGLAHHPAQVVGRSGSVAAYVEHGLPVLLPVGRLDEEDEFTLYWRTFLLSAHEKVSPLRAVRNYKLSLLTRVADEMETYLV